MSWAVNPKQDEPQVILVEVATEKGVESLLAGLRSLKEEGAWLYLTQNSELLFTIESENGWEVSLEGTRLVVSVEEYNRADYKRLALSNYERAEMLNTNLVSELTRKARVRDLVHEQIARISTKLIGHEPGSTARTLYEQHLAFLKRVSAETDA